jgi:CxxC motif-containing protein (DUF1111 family)
MIQRQLRRGWLSVLVVALAASCSLEPRAYDHGPIAEGISGPMGSVAPFADAAQKAAFDRGKALAEKRFMLADGLGPAYNVTFCASCHERPTSGGSAGLYRNFYLGGLQIEGGAFFPTDSAGESGGVLRLYAHGPSLPSHPEVASNVNVAPQRNPIPFFGAGLLAELSEAEILAWSDPDDANGDGISGRPNYDRGFVGRFGRKAQTVSLEGFIRGPLFNHLGITTDPLSEEQKAALPVDSSGGAGKTALRWLRSALSQRAQAAAPDAPLQDDDGVADPELKSSDLFDLVTFTMLLAAPQVATELSAEQKTGQRSFDKIGCASCHRPRLNGPRGPLPVYSDLLLHDMGAKLADGFIMGDASGREFRTQPLWGLAAVGPYLHDGRASTVDEAIRLHAGEADAARSGYEALGDEERTSLLAFLDSLGGRDQYSPGLIPPDVPEPAAGSLGGPLADLAASDQEAFTRGRALFDKEFGLSDGVGSPRYNGDSCRACHFEPVVGGAGPRGVDVIRHGTQDADGNFKAPDVGTVLHRLSADYAAGPVLMAAGSNVFELRQTPPLFGVGLIEAIPEAAILAGEDPDDLLIPDGISGRAHRLSGELLGRFGWKAQVPSLAEFVRDAMAVELGITLPKQQGLTFGITSDTDSVPDPELSLAQVQDMTRYLQLLAPPPRNADVDATLATAGAATFESVGCAKCHRPSFASSAGPVQLYSDLLLHDVAQEQTRGVVDGAATEREFRTPPLWGIYATAPYMHDGTADTLDQAILLHAGEAVAVVAAYQGLSDVERATLLEFLRSL